MDWREKLPFLKWNEAGDAVSSGLDDDGKWGWACVDGSVILYGTDPRLAEYEAYCEARRREKFKRDRELIERIHEMVADVNDPEPFPRELLRERPGFAAWIAGQNQHYRPTIFELRCLYPAYMERLRKMNERRVGGNVGYEAIADPVGPADKAKGKRTPINARMMDLISKNQDCHTWSARQFAEALGCSKSTVSETKAWASLKVYREMAREERAAAKQTKWQRKGQKTGR